MKMPEHLKLLDGGNYAPRIIERLNIHKETIYYVWTPTKEGPARPDYNAALADLRDIMEK